MRTLLVVVVSLTVFGSTGCRKRVKVASTPEGKKCQRECMMVYQTCVSGRGGRHACRSDENECLRTCPMAEPAAAPSASAYEPE